MPTKKPLSPTVEVMSDGENIFVVARWHQDCQTWWTRNPTGQDLGFT